MPDKRRTAEGIMCQNGMILLVSIASQKNPKQNLTLRDKQLDVLAFGNDRFKACIPSN